MLVDYFELLIPLTALASGPLMLWIIFYYISKNKTEAQKTIQTMIESGQQLPPEVIADLRNLQKATPEEKREKDLRWGVIFTMIGAAMSLAGIPAIMYGQWDDIWDGGWFVLLFLSIGIARLILWKLAPAGKSSSQD